ncbi:hypothetical protein C8K38_12485 [Rhodococcus sp. OK611]|uniref:hypothetical protein n=1 Tax=unclassified Rhodococcus (in: high G+C Gram-positive bacteria) TaxID=192944 RepID=UPI000BCDDE04|nr:MULTISPECIES: hypothetical protein [unclassified Rhodococcus (in: high G+C Gram-positive bacteria)]PTR36490.1 hypothetical protein C8K38_12485 [Rhodococcus sp. OK611]SNX93977.1 hypothetical protein SAMN05447004_12585 [Rhodococcus sp. OK270]
MFKRSFVVLAALTLAAFAAGCGNDSSDISTTTTSAAMSTTSAPTTTAAPATPAALTPETPPVSLPPVVVSPAQGPVGADGSTGNNLSTEYCARNQDPGCPIGSYVAPDAIPHPDGSGKYVPCEGTICTNPDHGAGTDPQQNGGAVMENPNGDGTAVPCEGTICTNPNNGAGG